MKRNWKKHFYAVDLFCGGGGLSQGLKEAGFTVTAGIEMDLDATATYAANHPETKLFAKDIRTVSGDEILNTSPEHRIDLIAACPPCQGFSSLTAKYKKEDSRNSLIFEFVRITEEIRPKTIMLENVPGLATGRGKVFFDRALTRLKELGYTIDYKVCDVANYGVPQHRKRLVVLGCLDHNIKVAPQTHGCDPSLKPWKTVRDVITNITPPSIYSGKPAFVDNIDKQWNVVRRLSDLNVQRLRALPSEADRRALPNSLRPKCHQNREKGFINVYGRMKWDEPSPTITGGCTTLSKGRFGHPEAVRTISVLEAALLQTFPVNYKLSASSLDAVCKIIGNALPPLFAKIMATQCLNVLRKENGK